MESFDELKKILNSQFEIDLLSAAFSNLNDTSNVLRYHNFAYSIRELSRHFLGSLSPDEAVKNCSWFKILTDDGKITRSQRIKYAIQGGIGDELLQNHNFDLKELEIIIKSTLEAINSLSKFTHIQPESFYLTEEQIQENSNEVLAAFHSFVQIIDDYRKKLIDLLDGYIEEHMIESLVTNFFENVDSIAPHHSVDSCDLTSYQIIEINERNIVVSVTGFINITLEYGSRKDRSEGDGLDLDKSFPFETNIFYEIEDNFPSDNFEIEEFDVDTSEWYK